MAKSKLNVLGLVLICVAAAGLVLAIVGIAVPWYSGKIETFVGGTSESFGLFAKYPEVDLPVALVQSFAIITLVLTAAACATVALNSLGVVKVKWLIRVICAAVVILFAVLTFVFALVYGNQFATAGVLGSTNLAANAGAYLLPIGAIVSAVPLFFGKN